MKSAVELLLLLLTLIWIGALCWMAVHFFSAEVAVGPGSGIDDPRVRAGFRVFLGAVAAFALLSFLRRRRR